MSFFTVDIGELRRQWMKLYLNLMRIRSRNEAANIFIIKFQKFFAETNEEMMRFFGTLEV